MQSHVAIRSQPVNEYVYVNRRIYHSVNNNVLKYQLCEDLHEETNSLIQFIHASSVDQDYPLKLWLLTSIVNPQTAEETHYNTDHSQAQSVMEHTIDMLKVKYQCLDVAKERLFTIDYLVYVVLPNITVSYGLLLHPEDIGMDEPDDPPSSTPANKYANATRCHTVGIQIISTIMKPSK